MLVAAVALGGCSAARAQQPNVHSSAALSGPHGEGGKISHVNGEAYISYN